MILGTGRAAAITDVELAELADELAVHPADLEAIAIVESGGVGWFRDGRIKILWEYHWFYKLVGAPRRARAVELGLARPRWISPARGGYKGQATADARYALLRRGMALDEAAALQAISIGRFQIMGFNYAICGFASPRAMWDAFCDSERHQVAALANFLKAKGLVPALRRRDFAKIEKVYNGGGLKGTYARRMRVESDVLRAGKWSRYKPGPPPRPAPADQAADPIDQAADPVEQITLPVDRAVDPRPIDPTPATSPPPPPLPPAATSAAREPGRLIVFLHNLLRWLNPFARTNWQAIPAPGERRRRA
ncbi:MAG: N-acetylmuramidase family protein [Rhodospirillaceae bacterium]